MSESAKTFALKLRRKNLDFYNSLLFSFFNMVGNKDLKASNELHFLESEASHSLPPPPMKEAIIRKKALEILEAKGYICWCPTKVKWHETDIFGVFDVICISNKKIGALFIQWTDITNISHRVKKVKNFLKENNLSLYCEVWGLDPKKKKFKIIHIYNG